MGGPSVSGTNSVPNFRVCWWFGGTKTDHTLKMGKELIPETSYNFHVLTQLAARENFTVMSSLVPLRQDQDLSLILPGSWGYLGAYGNRNARSDKRGTILCFHLDFLLLSVDCLLPQKNKTRHIPVTWHWRMFVRTLVQWKRNKYYEWSLYTCLRYQQANCIFSALYYTVNGSLSDSTLFFHITS
jgi:hypothetical protein